MNRVAAYIEIKNGVIKKSNFELLTMIRQSGKTCSAIVFSDDAGRYQDELGSYGASEVISVSGVAEYCAESYASEISRLVKDMKFCQVVASCSSQGKDLMPRVAALLDAPIITDCINLDVENSIAVKPTYAGKIITKFKVSGEVKIFTLRSNSISAVKAGPASTPTLKEIKGEKLSNPRAKIIEIVKSVTSAVDLTEAEIIVSGGRGVGSRENFKIISELADVLGAAVGSSRAAVDAQYADQNMQVGQTGKTVSPKLYIACGISGAIQHFAGMKTSKIIVAINKDPEAPIFSKSDYGIVEDLFTIVPMLTDEFKKVLEK